MARARAMPVASSTLILVVIFVPIVFFSEYVRRQVTATFGWRALLKIKHVPEQLFDVTAFPIIMVLMFTYLFGGAIGGTPRDYLQFFLPGIMVTSVVMITMYTGVGLNTDIEKGVFDRFRTLPVWRPSALVGMIFGDVLRYVLAALVILGVGLVLGFRPEGGVVGVLAGVGLLVVFSFAFSWVWTMFGLVLRSEKSVMGVSMLVLFPLTFASNIFVDPATMPGWLRRFVEVNPISHLVGLTARRSGEDPVLHGGGVQDEGPHTLGVGLLRHQRPPDVRVVSDRDARRGLVVRLGQVRTLDAVLGELQCVEVAGRESRDGLGADHHPGVLDHLEHLRDAVVHLAQQVAHRGDAVLPERQLAGRRRLEPHLVLDVRGEDAVALAERARRGVEAELRRRGEPHPTSVFGLDRERVEPVLAGHTCQLTNNRAHRLVNASGFADSRPRNKFLTHAYGRINIVSPNPLNDWRP